VAFDWSNDKKHGVKPVREEIDDRLARGIVWHRRDVDTRALLEELHHEVHVAAQALNAERNLAGVTFRVSDEFRNRPCGQ